MGERYLVCEGGPNSLDMRVLDALVTRHLDVQIMPGAGENSIGSVRSWLEERSRPNLPDGSLGPAQDVAFAVFDRNYLSFDEAQKKWKNPRHFVWLRHEIENYLLEPRVVFSAFSYVRKTTNQEWVKGLPATESAVRTLLEDLARPLLEEHAAQAVYFQIQLDRRRTCPREPGLSEMFAGNPAGTSSRESWLNALLAACRQVSDGCRTVAATAQEESDRQIREKYGEAVTQVTAPEFLSTGKFLCEMDGKRLLRSLATHLREQLGASKLSNDDFDQELVTALVREYQPNNLFKPDEFLEIAEKIKIAVP